MAQGVRVHWLQHAEHEELGCIGPWLKAQGFRATRTALFAGEYPPPATDFDWLIVMGGPMNIYEHAEHPWLIAEKALIRDACVKNKPILGICLGAQLLADVMGGKVTKNSEAEIGWFPVRLTDDGARSGLAFFPSGTEVFHWHEDTFAIPADCSNLMESDACVNQAFAQGERRVGLQFHLEVRQDDARRWLASEVPAPARYVQTAEEMLCKPERFAAQNALMVKVLERMAGAL